MGQFISRQAFPVPHTHTACSLPLVHITTLCQNYTIPAFYIHKSHILPTIIYSHGNGECLAHIESFARHLSDSLQANVFCYEYIGYPRSRTIPSAELQVSAFVADPEPSEANCYMSIKSAHNYVTNVLGVPESDQIYMGHSIGTGPTTYIVHSLCKIGKSPRGMILSAPFLSATAVVSELLDSLYPMFPNYKYAKEIQCPTLILHGSADDVIEATQSKKLERYFPVKVTRHVIAYAGHNNLQQFQEYEQSLVKFVNVLKK